LDHSRKRVDRVHHLLGLKRSLDLLGAAHTAPGSGRRFPGTLRDRVELVYVTPLPGAFTKPVCSSRLGYMLDDRKIALEPDFMVERIDGTTLVSYDEREIGFDLLVTVPLNMGADYVARSGLGNELNLVPVDRHTMLSKAHDNIFAPAFDANDIPTSKAGSVALFAVVEDIINAADFIEKTDGAQLLFI
jgi:sulfide:quinone oxidoreductase